MRYFIKTFGCQHNLADSERIASLFEKKGGFPATSYKDADVVVINTCMIRESAENRVYGLVRNLGMIKKEKEAQGKAYRIIVTGCMVGMAARDKTGIYLQKLKKRMPAADEFLPIEEVGYSNQPMRSYKNTALLPISNGCNNFCTYCVVPFTRGREVSRPYEEVLAEAQKIKDEGYENIILIGQNVNSYGSDLVVLNQKKGALNPVYVKHLGKHRIPTLFPHLLADIAQCGFSFVDFISSNPWDFSNELIATIAQHPNITRTIHLPLQSGDDQVLKRMNRWYTGKEYMQLIDRIRQEVPRVTFTTDIIVGFCGETDIEFQHTVDVCKYVQFEKAYISEYSPRPFAHAGKAFTDDIPHAVKKRRWLILEELINKPFLERLAQSKKVV